jgi:hypothetical protein
VLDKNLPNKKASLLASRLALAHLFFQVTISVNHLAFATLGMGWVEAQAVAG